jgi:hypothetical protein
LEQNKLVLMYRNLETLLGEFGYFPRIHIYKIVVRHIYDELLFFLIIKKGKKERPQIPIPKRPKIPFPKPDLKKRYTYDKIVPQRKDWSEDMIELEENQKELQTLSDKLKEIGESL